MTEQDDLRRDVIKSESADVTIPELDLHLGPGTLGGLVTTVEGLLTQSQVHISDRPYQSCGLHLANSC